MKLPNIVIAAATAAMISVVGVGAATAADYSNKVHTIAANAQARALQAEADEQARVAAAQAAAEAKAAEEAAAVAAAAEAARVEAARVEAAAAAEAARVQAEAEAAAAQAEADAEAARVQAAAEAAAAQAQAASLPFQATASKAPAANPAPAPAPVQAVQPAPANTPEAMLAKYRAILNAVGGANIRLEWQPGATASSWSSGVIYIGENIFGDPYWAMRHELAHQYIFRVNQNTVIASPAFQSLFGGNIEILTNCIATVMGSSDGTPCGPDRINYARAILNGYLP
ncbi:hypothetical protein ANMWB30_23820 [Arthrobacter sp. MWB30]|nr:hypothetical protein ANMWB30_23820 [Arthrobacter sp. MWB30]